MVHGALLWAEEELEAQLRLQEQSLDWQSWFSANIMYSSGNFKKNVKTLDIKKSLFTTEEEQQEDTPENKKRTAEEEKARLQAVFNLPDDQT